MSERIGERLAGNDEQGFSFTLIELLVLTVIIGILLAVAVPSYLGFRDRAANNSARTNLRGGPAVGRGVLRGPRHLRQHGRGRSRRDRLGYLVDPRRRRHAHLEDVLPHRHGQRQDLERKGPAASDDGSSTDDWFTTSDCS